MKITSKKKAITATIKLSEEDLRLAIEDTLDSDDCEEIVSLGYSYDDNFQDEWFMGIEEFCDVFLSNETPLEVAQAFWNGTDLDEHENHANPESDYARYDRHGTIETTDYPGDIYYDELLDEIIDYIIEYRDTRYDDFPTEIQELLDQYEEYNPETSEDE